MNNILNFFNNILSFKFIENFDDINMETHISKYDTMFMGKVSEKTELSEKLYNINKEFEDIYKDNNKMTLHMWRREFNNKLLEQVSFLENPEIWREYICNGSKNCKIKYVSEMTELYKSTVPFQREGVNLYGASGNFDLHVDCAFPFYPNVTLYRVLIGLTNENEYVYTKFPDHNISHKMNFGDIAIFDFNNTKHQVKKVKDIDESRNMLKLHFIICKNCTDKYASRYIDFCMDGYNAYENITRHVMKNGTNPESLYDFFCGLNGHWAVKKVQFFQYMLLLLCLSPFHKIFKDHFYLTLIVYVFLIKFYWLRYNLTGHR